MALQVPASFSRRLQAQTFVAHNTGRIPMSCSWRLQAHPFVALQVPGSICGITGRLPGGFSGLQSQFFVAIQVPGTFNPPQTQLFGG